MRPRNPRGWRRGDRLGKPTDSWKGHDRAGAWWAGSVATGGMLRVPAPLESRVKRRLRPLRRIHGLIQAELRDRHRVGLRLRWRALRHGFTSRSWRLYDLFHNDPDDYLPDYPDLDYGENAIHRVAITDKLLFPRVMSALGAPHARVVAYLAGGVLLDLGGDGVGQRTRELTLTELLERHGALVLKPVDGRAGFGVLFVTRSDEGIRLNGNVLGPHRIAELLAQLDDFIVCPRVAQHTYSGTIAPASTNTVRALTVWDVDRQQPFVAAAAHRFGTARTAPVDNFHAGSGGLSAPIALSDGRLGAALGLDATGKLGRWERHPETGAVIEGVPVPFWPETVALLERIAAALPQTPYIGWDLVVTDDGPCLLEGNAPPGAMVWQVHGGLLRDLRTRTFFRRYGLLAARR